MPIRYDSVLAGAVSVELARRLAGRTLEELHFRPESRTVLLALDDGSRLAWLLHPTAGHVLWQEPVPSLQNRRGRNAGRGALRGARPVRSVSAPHDERVVVVALGPPRRREAAEAPDATLVCELLTNQWNALLVEEGRIRALLWRRTAGGRELREGAPYGMPASNRLWKDRDPAAAEWTRRLAAGDPTERARDVVRSVAWTSPLNAAWLLGPPGDAVQAPDAQIGRWRQLREAARGGDPARTEAWLLPVAGGWQPYPHALGIPDAEPAVSLLAAMAEAARRDGVAIPEDAPPPGRPAGVSRRVEQETEALTRRLRRHLRGARRRRAALRRELEEGPDPDALRDTGHLLLARLRELPRGATSVRLTDFEGRERDVELDPRLDGAANAERLFDRARRRDRARASLPSRIARTSREVEALETALEELARTGPTDAVRALAGADAPGSRPGGRRGRGPEDTGDRRPYLRLRSSGGLEIRVGRSARGNDALTFHDSAPEDIWLHARHERGAHVILRWGRRDQNPPERDLAEAAMAAAVHSGARTSGTVPVDWTRRKYVRKPRGAAPGAVRPERVRTVFVAPDAALVGRLRDRGGAADGGTADGGTGS
ncbi:MAG: NFACT RNA binding domain-containing protein [Gemmatimonadota bacterium]|nr:NFACT RNA binding domain-containing protein [Gemmatimonadota bacterium]